MLKLFFEEEKNKLVSNYSISLIHWEMTKKIVGRWRFRRCSLINIIKAVCPLLMLWRALYLYNKNFIYIAAITDRKLFFVIILPTNEHLLCNLPRSLCSICCAMSKMDILFGKYKFSVAIWDGCFKFLGNAMMNWDT